MVSVFHRELAYKVEKLTIINKSEPPVEEWTILDRGRGTYLRGGKRGFTVFKFHAHFMSEFSFCHICLRQRSTFGYCSIL